MAVFKIYISLRNRAANYKKKRNPARHVGLPRFAYVPITFCNCLLRNELTRVAMESFSEIMRNREDFAEFRRERVDGVQWNVGEDTSNTELDREIFVCVPGVCGTQFND